MTDATRADLQAQKDRLDAGLEGGEISSREVSPSTRTRKTCLTRLTLDTGFIEARYNLSTDPMPGTEFEEKYSKRRKNVILRQELEAGTIYDYVDVSVARRSFYLQVPLPEIIYSVAFSPEESISGGVIAEMPKWRGLNGNERQPPSSQEGGGFSLPVPGGRCSQRLRLRRRCSSASCSACRKRERSALENGAGPPKCPPAPGPSPLVPTEARRSAIIPRVATAPPMLASVKGFPVGASTLAPASRQRWASRISAVMTTASGCAAAAIQSRGIKAVVHDL